MPEYTILLTGGLAGQRMFRFIYNTLGEPPEEFEVLLRPKGGKKETWLTYHLDRVERARLYLEEGTMVAHYQEVFAEYGDLPQSPDSGPFKRVIEEL